MFAFSTLLSATLGLVYIILLSSANSFGNTSSKGETSDYEFSLLNTESEREHEVVNILNVTANIPSNNQNERSFQTNTSNSVYDFLSVDYYRPENERCETFNYTRALILGLRFQKEFCADKTFSNCHLFHGYHHECPVCVESFPGDTLKRNNNLSLPEHGIETSTPVKIQRMEYKPFHYVTIIASCPENAFSANSSFVTTEENFKGKNETAETRNWQSRIHSKHCDECLEHDNYTALVTSSISGLTYCNQHCLTCNEDSIQPSSIFVWNKVPVCPVGKYPESTWTPFPDIPDSSGASNDGASREACWLEFDPPPVVIPRNSDDGDGLDRVDVCGTESLAEVDNDTFEKMRSLCSSYYWPVLTEKFLYRNIFCYLCQQRNQSEICLHMIHLTLNMEPPVFLGTSVDIDLALLTDLSGYHFRNDLNDGQEKFFFNPEIDETDEEGNAVTLRENEAGGPLYVNGCAEGFWFNFLTGKCISVQCNKGRQLRNSTEGSNVMQCLMTDTENTKALKQSLFSLKILWYEDKDDVDLREEESVELDSISNSTSGEHSQRKPFSCERVNDFQHRGFVYTDNTNYIEEKTLPNSRKLENVFFSHESNFSRHNIKIATFGNGSAYQNLKKIEDLDNEIMNKTHLKLKQLNISSYLIRLFTSSPNTNGSDTKYFNLHEARKMVVYFQRQSYGNWTKFFDAEILKRFSEKVQVFTTHGQSLEFRSVLLKKHYGLKDIQSTKYYIAKTEQNESVCCDEINFQKFSSVLSSMACYGENPEPVNIHLVSPCPHVTLNSSDFKMAAKQTLIHKSTGITLQRHQYLFSQSGILICTSVIDSLRPSPTVSILSDNNIMRWGSLLTLVFLPVSMLCLLITFITYSVFPVLRSMPGKNNMFLVFWLFWAQTLTIVSPLTPRHSTACVIMGMLLHFSWLATLAWTCVCSFHMFNVFVVNKGTPNTTRSHRWYLAWYSLLSHLLPLLVVAIVCVTSSSATAAGSLGYGGIVCYLNSTALIGSAFVLPLGLILVMNAVFFSCTIITISRIEKIKRQTGRGRRNTHIYARLSSLTGITWVLALLAEIPGCQFLRLISVTFNSCQGIFLFVSYIINRRVKRLWMKRSSKGHGSKSSSTITASTRLTATNSNA